VTRVMERKTSEDHDIKMNSNSNGTRDFVNSAVKGLVYLFVTAALALLVTAVSVNGAQNTRIALIESYIVTESDKNNKLEDTHDLILKKLTEIQVCLRIQTVATGATCEFAN